MKNKMKTILTIIKKYGHITVTISLLAFSIFLFWQQKKKESKISSQFHEFKMDLGQTRIDMLDLRINTSKKLTEIYGWIK